MELTDWVAVAAVGMSAIALIIAGAAARHARRSADAAERSVSASEEAARAASHIADLEQERRHEELAPRFAVRSDGSINIQGLSHAGMWVTLEGPLDLDEVRLRFEPPADGEPYEVQRVLVGSKNYALQSGQEMQAGFPLQRSQRFRVLFERNDTPRGRNLVRLRCESRVHGHLPWVTTLEGRTPGKVRVW